MSILTSATRTTIVAAGFSGLSILGTPAVAQNIGQFEPLLGSTTIDQVYTPVTPCRFVDGINAADRVASAANGTTARYYKVRGSTPSDFVSQGAAGTAPTGCGIPTSATAVMVNLTVADPDADGDLKADPADALAPSSTSALNYTFGGARGKNLANAVIVKLCDLTLSACASGAMPTSPTRDILVTFHAGGAPVSTYFLADVLGFFRAGAAHWSGHVGDDLSAAGVERRGNAEHFPGGDHPGRERRDRSSNGGGWAFRCENGGLVPRGPGCHGVHRSRCDRLRFASDVWRRRERW